MELVILGCGGQGREIFGIARSLGHRVAGFMDDAPTSSNLASISRLGVPIFGELNQLSKFSAVTHYVIGIADGRIREMVAREADRLGLEPAILIHQSATVGFDCQVGVGSVLWPGARLTTNITVGRHVHVNQNTTVGHDTVLHDFSTLNPLAAVSGDCSVGTRAMVGAGSSVLQGRNVGRDAKVGAGACVVRSVPDGNIVKGVPAR